MLSHGNALTFVDWCSRCSTPTTTTDSAVHAPFHFDLSVFDLYVAVSTARRSYLISEDLGKDAQDLAAFLADEPTDVWYSTPSILTLLAQFGALEAHDCSRFGSCSSPARSFRSSTSARVRALWPKPRFWNLYGPTETNVCTFARIPDGHPADA